MNLSTRIHVDRINQTSAHFFFPPSLYFVDTAVIWAHYPHIPWNHVLQFPSTEITPAEEGRTGQQATRELSRCFGKLGQTDLFVKKKKSMFNWKKKIEKELVLFTVPCYNIPCRHMLQNFNWDQHEVIAKVSKE